MAIKPFLLKFLAFLACVTCTFCINAYEIESKGFFSDITDTFTPGDLNDDGKLDVADVVTLIDVVLGKAVADSSISDLNGDGFVDVSDVTLLIEYVLGITQSGYDYELTVNERAIVDDIKALLNKYNPNKEFITFGFITDTHTCMTRAEIQEATDVEEVIQSIKSQGITLEPADEGSTIAADIKSKWPIDHEGVNPYCGRTAEPLIRMLGAVAFEYGMDVVIHGGDVSSGYLKYNAYAYMMEKVARLFDKYISVPHFICEGNHDYKYDSNVAVRPNSDWRKYADRFNDLTGLSLNYVKDIPEAQSYSARYNIDISDYTSFYVDIDKGGLNKLRFASAVVFERDMNYPNPSPISRYFVLNMEDKEDVSQWSAMNVAHVQDNNYLDNYAGAFFNASNMGAYGSTENTYSFPKQNGGKKPKSYVGAIFGHNHDSSYKRVPLVGGGYAPQIRVANSFVDDEVLPTFSIFIFDTTDWWLYEIQAVNRRRGASSFSEGIYEYTDSLENVWCFRYKLSHH